MSTTNDKPGSGFLGWLGRQVGHVRKAVKTPVDQKPIYRNEVVDELPHPANPNVTLRRTTIDEAIEVKTLPPRNDADARDC